MSTDRPSRPALTRALLGAGVAVGPLTCSVFTFEGRRRSGYEPRRHPISALALGPRGWVQQTNFLVSGALTLAAATGLRRTMQTGTLAATVPMSIAAAGAGLIGAGIFPTDPVPGYPPAEGSSATHLRLGSLSAGLKPTMAGPAGVPDRPLSRTGSLHVLSAVPFFVGLPLAASIGAWRARQHGDRAGAVALAAAAAVCMAGSSGAGAGFAGKWGLEETGGRWQRISVVAGFAGLAALSARAVP